MKFVNLQSIIMLPFQLAIKELLFLFLLFIVMFGDLLRFLIFRGLDGLLCILMIVLVCLRSFFLNRNLMSAVSFQTFII